MYMLPGKKRQKIEDRYHYGLFLGVDKRANELYVADTVIGDDEPRYGRFLVFTLAGEYLREVRPPDMKDPFALHYIHGRLYVTDYVAPEGKARVLVLTTDGKTLQIYQHEAFRLDGDLALFAGGLVVCPRADGMIHEDGTPTFAFLGGV